MKTTLSIGSEPVAIEINPRRTVADTRSTQAALEDEITAENVIDSSLPSLEGWASEYFPNNAKLAEELVAETKLHVLKLHDEGCLQGNPAYYFYLSQHGADANAKEKLDAKLVRATMESVLYHHFINPDETSGRKYSGVAQFIDSNHRMGKLMSGSIQEASNMFYLITGKILGGTKPSLTEVLVEKKYRTELDSPLASSESNLQIQMNHRMRKGGKLKKQKKHTKNSAIGIKEFAEDSGLKGQWISRAYEYGKSLELSSDQHRYLITRIGTEPDFELGFRADYRRLVSGGGTDSDFITQFKGAYKNDII